MKIYAHSSSVWWKIEFKIPYHCGVGDINYSCIVTSLKILTASSQVQMFFHRQWTVLLYCLKQLEEEIQIL